MSVAEYLKKPYARFVLPESDGSFRAEIIEFPGCIATGDTAAEALASLEDVAASWLEATLARGQQIPEPMENVDFSGKLVLRLPKSLHKKAAHAAERDGSSLNQFIVTCIAEQVGARSINPAKQVTISSGLHLTPIFLSMHSSGRNLHTISRSDSGTSMVTSPWERSNAGG